MVEQREKMTHAVTWPKNGEWRANTSYEQRACARAQLTGNGVLSCSITVNGFRSVPLHSKWDVVPRRYQRFRAIILPMLPFSKLKTTAVTSSAMVVATHTRLHGVTTRKTTTGTSVQCSYPPPTRNDPLHTDTSPVSRPFTWLQSRNSHTNIRTSGSEHLTLLNEKRAQ
jgi:hypothetical protein